MKNVKTNVKELKKVSKIISPSKLPHLRLTQNINVCQEYKASCLNQNMIIDGAGGTGKNRNLIDPNIRLYNHNILVIEWRKEIYEEHKQGLLKKGYQIFTSDIQELNQENIQIVANNLIKQPKYAAFIFIPIKNTVFSIDDTDKEMYGNIILSLYKKILSVSYDIEGMPDCHPHIQAYIDDLMELVLSIPYFHRILQLCKNHNLSTFMTVNGIFQYSHNAVLKSFLYVCDFFLFMGTNDIESAKYIAKIFNIGNWKNILIMPNEECLLYIEDKGVFRDKKIKL